MAFEAGEDLNVLAGDKLLRRCLGDRAAGTLGVPYDQVHRMRRDLLCVQLHVEPRAPFDLFPEIRGAARLRGDQTDLDLACLRCTRQQQGGDAGGEYCRHASHE